MKKNTILTIIGLVCAFINGMLSMDLFQAVQSSNLRTAIVLIMLIAYAGGIFLGFSSTARGYVCSFKELDDGVYFMLGKVGPVFTLRHVNKSGEEMHYAVQDDWPSVLDPVRRGISFRKVGKKIIVL